MLICKLAVSQRHRGWSWLALGFHGESIMITSKQCGCRSCPVVVVGMLAAPSTTRVDVVGVALYQTVLSGCGLSAPSPATAAVSAPHHPQHLPHHLRSPRPQLLLVLEVVGLSAPALLEISIAVRYSNLLEALIASSFPAMRTSEAGCHQTWRGVARKMFAFRPSWGRARGAAGLCLA